MLLTKAENETAYLSAAIYGFAGSGKSFTAACIAIGLHRYIKSKGPVAYIDTEAGTDFLLPHYKHNDIETLRSKTRSFQDIFTIIKECKIAGSEILIIDSCTHLWDELCKAYEKKYKRLNGLQFQDWKNVKGEWSKFMTAVLNEPLHMILLGRAGYDWNYEDIDGKKILIKTDTKMRAEKETAHEPSLTLEMDQETLSDAEIKTIARKQQAGISTKVTGQFASYFMYVLKDRANFLTGSVFKYPPSPGKMIEPDNPPFKDVLPFIEAINIGGTHKGVDTSRTSEEMFAGTDSSYSERKKQRKILTEKLKTDLETEFGKTKDEKKRLKEFLIKHFATHSWTEITESLEYGVFKNGYDSAWVELNPDDAAGSGGNEGPSTSPAPQGSLENVVSPNRQRDTSEPVQDHTAQEVNRKQGLVDYPEIEDPLGIVDLMKLSKFDEAWRKLDGYKA